MNEITFLGHLISAEGIRPDPKKTDAIHNMPEPTCVKGLQRFLAIVTYPAKFIQKLSDHTAPVRTLLQKDVMWTFDEPQRTAVEKLKQLVTSSPVLQYYNPNLPTRVSSDASQEGLGAVLEQRENDWHPIAYASRSLTSAKQNYCPLEKEILQGLIEVKVDNGIPYLGATNLGAQIKNVKKKEKEKKGEGKERRRGRKGRGRGREKYFGQLPPPKIIFWINPCTVNCFCL